MERFEKYEIVKYNDVLGKIIPDSDKKSVYRFLPAAYGIYSTSQLEIVTFDNLKKTTHDEKVEFLKKEYVWGNVIKVHDIGEYIIFEDDRNAFHLYINYRDSNHSYYSLDTALIGGICLKYDGINEHASDYIYKMLGMNKDKDNGEV